MVICSNFFIFLKIKLDIEIDEYKTTAGDDLLVLPSQKRPTKIKQTERAIKILSRKQRKRLEKIVEKKQKKENVNIFIRLNLIIK